MTTHAQYYVADRVTCLFDNDVRIQMGSIERAMNYYFHNADGDELHYAHSGCGMLNCGFSNCPYWTGDYIVVSKGTVYLLEPYEI